MEPEITEVVFVHTICVNYSKATGYIVNVSGLLG